MIVLDDAGNNIASVMEFSEGEFEGMFLFDGTLYRLPKKERRLFCSYTEKGVREGDSRVINGVPCVASFVTDHGGVAKVSWEPVDPKLRSEAEIRAYSYWLMLQTCLRELEKRVANEAE